MNNTQYTYMVGVRCFTFQHAKYITDTLNGFCMQQTDFPYLCMVMDDASTDGEQQVIRQYIAEHFNVTGTRPISDSLGEYVFADHQENKNCSLVYVELAKNLYGVKGAKMKLLAEWRENCKYEAMCEGDDYWIDPQKLQKQVEYMEEHKDIMLCHTDFSRYIEDDNRMEKDMYESGFWTRPDSFISHCLSAGYIAPMTWLHRPLKIDTRGHIDGSFVCALELFAKNQIGYIPYTTAVYRYHLGSVSHQTNPERFNRYKRDVAMIQYEYAEQFHIEKMSVPQNQHDNAVRCGGNCALLAAHNKHYKRAFCYMWFSLKNVRNQKMLKTHFKYWAVLLKLKKHYLRY